MLQCYNIWVRFLKHCASVSFGKDSLAMLLLILEKEIPLDEVIFYDTGMEFGAIYSIRDSVSKMLNERNIKFTEISPPNTFIYDMLHREIHKKNGTIQHGFGWCGGACRWGTGIKTRALDKYTKNCHVYVGIAADEPERLARLGANKSSPIANAGMTEKDCLEFCHQNGFFWNEGRIELYTILNRVSCWCCRNKNIKELRNIYLYLPQYWDRLKELQLQIDMPMKHGYTVFDLEYRFEIEKEWIAKGQSIKSKSFYKELNACLARRTGG